jgi:hypothetical protein
MPSRRFAPLALALASLGAGLAPAALQAQLPDTIRTGHPVVATVLAAGVDTVDTYFVNAAGQRQLGVVYVETVVPVKDGFLVVQRNTRPNGAIVSLDTVEVDGRTLVARWHSDLTPRGSRRVTYANGRLTGTSTDSAGAVTPVEQAVAAGAIDYSLASLVVPHLPLREGYVATLALHDITRGAQSTTVRVLGREDVAVKSGTVSAWKVALDYGGFTATQWIDPAAKHAVRTEVARGPMKIVAERR